jgi:membrane protease subunit HflC
MMDLIARRPLFAGIGALLLLFVFLGSFPVVSETQQAVVVRFGKPHRILGGTQAGINWRIPFAENIEWIDKRILDVDMDRQQVLSTDQRRLEVDAFARFRIVDPLRMYISARSEERVVDALRPILGSELRNELGKRRFDELLSPERQGVMENVRQGLNSVARQYGAQIIDVRIKKADLPSGTPLQSAFDRMRTAREQEARSIRAEGAKRAQIVRAEADAQAARVYAGSFGKDPDFYEFYRAMESYRTTFLGDGTSTPAPTTVVLSPQNDYLKEFTGRER